MNTNTAWAEEAEKLNRQWMAAYVKRDVDFLEQHLTEDYISVFPDGTLLDKKGEIESLESGAVVLEAMTPNEMNVRIYGTTAVITGRSTIKAKVNGQETSGEFRFTDVWFKRGDGWQAVASQVTRIATP